MRRGTGTTACLLTGRVKGAIGLLNECNLASTGKHQQQLLSVSLLLDSALQRQTKGEISSCAGLSRSLMLPQHCWGISQGMRIRKKEEKKNLLVKCLSQLLLLRIRYVVFLIPLF